MKKTLIYFLLLLILGAGIYYLVSSNNANPYRPSEAGFTVKDTANVGKLFLVNNNGESILAERTDTGWMVNKKFRALKSTVDLVLGTIACQSALYPVTKNARENAVKQLATNAVKVEVYDRSNRKLSAFYVGGVAVNNTGTNMLLEGAQEPFVVQVPHFTGYLTSRFTTNIKDWRDRAIFNLPAAEIKSVSVQYPGGQSVNSFTITRDGSQFRIEANPEVMKTGPANMHRAELYLNYFTNINCEGYLNGLPDLDTFIRSAPVQSVIDLYGMHGQHLHLDAYWLAVNKRSKNVGIERSDVPENYDADRLYAVTHDRQDTVVIQFFVFRKIFRKGFEFFQKDPEPAPKTDPRDLPSGMLQKR